MEREQGMNCIELTDLEDYTSGLMPAKRARAVRRHIEACDRCRAMMDDFLANEALLARIRASQKERIRSQDDLAQLSRTETRISDGLGHRGAKRQ